MPRISLMFLQQGYELFYVPGISRAWRRELPNRSYLLITDIGGYDLPEPGGPYSGMYLSAQDELIEFIPWMPDARGLFGWVRHAERLAEFRQKSNDQLGGTP